MVLVRQTRTLWALFAVIAVTSALLVWQRPAWERLSDLHIYYGAVKAVQAGTPLYSYVAENGGPFTYPPFALLVLWPIGLAPEPAVQVAWLVLVGVAVIAIAVTLGRSIAAEKRGPVAAMIASALIISAPVQSNLRFGQVSIFIVLLALVDGVGLTPARYRGVLVGVAAAIKLTPLLFVLYFLISRRYSDGARALVSFAICGLAAAVALPAQSWTYWTGTMLTTSRIGDLASLGNQSLHGMLMRAGVAPTSLPVLWAGLVLIICGVALLRARTLTLTGQPAHAAVLVGCATVAASPVSWTHHQVWPVLAAMLLLAATGPLRRFAGVGLLVIMVASTGVLMSRLPTTQGFQFLFENLRALSVVALCLTGLGTLAARLHRVSLPARGSGLLSRWPFARAAVARRAGRVWGRGAVTAAAVLAFFAVLPLPAGADPTFKAYTAADVSNPRYFFVCHSYSACAAMVHEVPVNFTIFWEPTKVRVNGVVNATVARLEYQSAPGGAPRDVPLVDLYPGQRGFSFRSANISNGRITAYDSTGHPIATYRDRLATS